MDALHTDLFPETLLVDREGDRIFTTSLKVAEHFKKLHKNVLRAIENLACSEEFSQLNFQPRKSANELNFELIEEFSRLNFEPAKYQDSKGRTKPMFKITEEGFALLAMGFTGNEALLWKIQFLNAFRDMERLITARETRFAKVLDQIRPALRPVVEATEQGLSRSAIAAPLGKSPAAITYHRRKARQLGLLPN